MKGVTRGGRDGDGRRASTGDSASWHRCLATISSSAGLMTSLSSAETSAIWQHEIAAIPASSCICQLRSSSGDHLNYDFVEFCDEPTASNDSDYGRL